MTLTIRDFTDDLAPAFHAINAEWIEGMFTLEENDRLLLENPRTLIIDRGGVILFAEDPDLGIIGTVALMKAGDGVYELTKMGVLARAQGMKAGEALLAAALDRARTMGITTLYLLTNRICAPAIHLYEKLGFTHDADIMARYGTRYARCDVAMRWTPLSRLAGEGDSRDSACGVRVGAVAEPT
ncbi:GNAT family N-acetyltransferase [Sandaracinobacteroides saxicola]|uniref:GNAT family N-acetyltransferase n=1 Tax=Sandaracinobacteroides saxicola TaxID=2759707 RepID=A0A7G5II60_9SPHN|nr:GNAT family N-acetyltransferase [Sandaracinobacteroides saxicola]QMW23052.1 GNAT family N-acetyltransferase [Sandaracinobacteroides saxicola]